MSDRFEVRELPDEECWELVERSVVGRVAFVLGGRPRVYPVTLVRDGESVVFRTSTDAELAATRDADVIVEVDGFDADRQEAWSVLLAGPARAVTGSDELAEVGRLPLFPWHAAPKDLFVRVEPESISGRRFATPYAGPEGFHR